MGNWTGLAPLVSRSVHYGITANGAAARALGCGSARMRADPLRGPPDGDQMIFVIEISPHGHLSERRNPLSRLQNRAAPFQICPPICQILANHRAFSN